MVWDGDLEEPPKRADALRCAGVACAVRMATCVPEKFGEDQSEEPPKRADVLHGAKVACALRMATCLPEKFRKDHSAQVASVASRLESSASQAVIGAPALLSPAGRLGDAAASFHL